MYFVWQEYSLKMQISKGENACYKFFHLLQHCTYQLISTDTTHVVNL